MSVRPIIEIAPSELDQRDGVLRRKADLVSEFGADTQISIADLIQTFEAHKIAVGLAAPQIGISKRIAVVNITKGKEAPHTILVNPIVTTASSETQSGYESCMSIPRYKGKVERAKSICVEYFDQQGMKQTLLAEGFHARVILHEIDHLEGILYPDRMPEPTLEDTDLFNEDKSPPQKPE